MHTVSGSQCKYQKISIIQILCDINYQELKMSRITDLMIFENLNLVVSDETKAIILQLLI